MTTEKTKRTRRKRQKWQIGDYFLIPLVNNEFAIGQVIGRVIKALDSVICVFFAVKVRVEEEAQKKVKILSGKEVVSAKLTTRDSLDWGIWKIFNNAQPLSFNDYLSEKEVKIIVSKKIVGLVTEGSGIMTDFMNAFYALKPWDMYYEPDYFDNLLVSPDKKPRKLLYKKDLENKQEKVL